MQSPTFNLQNEPDLTINFTDLDSSRFISVLNDCHFKNSFPLFNEKFDEFQIF